MKKIGIVSCYFKNNYGSMLQAYATQKILDNYDIPNETIKVDNNVDFKKGKRKYYSTQLFNFKFIQSKFGMIKMVVDKKRIPSLGKNIAIRNCKYKEFRNEIRLSKDCVTYDELSKMANDSYSDVVVGSDQLWLPVNVVADYYTLNWVPNNVNKISYSTSFGISKIPSKYDEQYKSFLNRIDHVSVREESGKKILDGYGIGSTIVCDPTILLTKEEWDQEAVKERIIKDKYILCYFLGNNIEHRKFAEKLKKATGYKIVSLNHADEYVKYSDQFANIAPYDIGPREWINLIKNAEYVCTDSFHGTVFSLIFNKMFFDFRRYSENNKMSTNTRIDSLLDLAGVSKQRILTGKENVEDVLKYEIDYDVVNKKLDMFRQESRQWLLDSLETKKKTKIIEANCIDIKDKSLCCGCSACYSICPKNAIEMISDNEGFLYPQVNKDKCIECGLCKKVCPILKPNPINHFEQKGYIFQYGDDAIRKESTSGGAYTAIAEYVLEHSGVVYGVAMEDFYVKNIRITDKNELYKFRNSKYVQSDKNDTYRMVKEDLKNDILVCYSGTVCEIEGLKSYLGREYDNLITVDIICRAVPSPMLWKKYIEFRNKNNQATKAYFRKKVYGYKYSNLTVESDLKILYKNGVDTDPYLRAFFSNIACRPSCYNCHFKKQEHISDFTIWDCFNVDKYYLSFDDDLGTTRILINSEKGMDIFNSISNRHKSKEVDTDLLINNFHQMFNPIRMNNKRANFFIDLNDKPFNEVIDNYFPNTFKCKLEKYGRITLLKLGIYKPLINLGKKVRKRD